MFSYKKMGVFLFGFFCADLMLQRQLSLSHQLGVTFKHAKQSAKTDKDWQDQFSPTKRQEVI